MLKERYGEFPCPHCKLVFHDRKKLSGHIGGAHRRCITDSEVPRCKKCDTRLFEGQNWPKWAVKQRNLICKKCKNLQNKESYRTRTMLKHSALKSKLPVGNPHRETIVEKLRRLQKT